MSNRVSRRQGQQWAAAGSRTGSHSRQLQRPRPPQAGGEDSVIDQLKQLGELKAQGILTEEEFAAQKAKLLG